MIRESECNPEDLASLTNQVIYCRECQVSEDDATVHPCGLCSSCLFNGRHVHDD